MSAGAMVRSALAAEVRAGLPGVEVYDGEAAAGVRPSIAIGEPAAVDWSAVGVRGRELRTATTVRVANGQRERLETLCAGVERAGEAVRGEIGGWRVVGAVFLRTRPVPDKNGVAVLVEHRVRVVEI